MGVLSAVEHIFNGTALQARTQASNRLAKANRASHGPREKAKERVKRTRENPRESRKEPEVRTKVPKACTRAKTSNTGLSGLEKFEINQRQARKTQESAQTCHTDNSWIHDGWSFDEWNDDWSSVGWHEGWEQTYDTSASSFSLGLDLGATSR